MTETTETVQSLEAKIRNAIADIAANKTSPGKSGIGPLFAQLREIDSAACALLTQEYKPVCESYNGTLKRRLDEINKKVESESMNALTGEEKEILKTEEQKKKDAADRVRRKAAIIDAAMNSILKGGTAGGVEYNDKPKKSPKVREPKVKVPKNPDGERDRSAYKFNGIVYGKGPLALAVAKKIHADNQNMTVEEFRMKLPDQLMRSYGVIQRHDKAQPKRFFLKDDQLIRCKDGVVAVCSQWDLARITPFVAHVIKLGYAIEVTTK